MHPSRDGLSSRAPCHANKAAESFSGHNGSQIAFFVNYIFLYRNSRLSEDPNDIAHNRYMMYTSNTVASF